MRIGVPKETAAGEKRVATVPEVVEKREARSEKREVMSRFPRAARMTR